MPDIDPTIFKAYDVRGLYGEQIDEDVAYRVGRKLEWDSANLRATNAPEAAPFIRREYRPGWSLS